MIKETIAKLLQEESENEQLIRLHQALTRLLLKRGLISPVSGGAAAAATAAPGQAAPPQFGGGALPPPQQPPQQGEEGSTWYKPWTWFDDEEGVNRSLGYDAFDIDEVAYDGRQPTLPANVEYLNDDEPAGVYDEDFVEVEEDS